MPKKTKKQKMASDKRKFNLQPRTKDIQIETKEPISPVINNTQKLPKSIPEAGTVVFKKDFSKSLLISCVIILVEIGIFLVQNEVIPVTNLLK